MTPEQKQRIEQIRERQRQRRLNNFHYDVAVAVRDIDFLLSLVKSQEAVGGDAVSRQEVITRIEREIRLWHNDTVTMACADMLAELKQMPTVPDAATSMRSACVEKVKELMEHEAVNSDRRSAMIDVISELESLSIEKPKEQPHEILN